MALQPPNNNGTPTWVQSCKQDETKIGFLDLPRELRDLVYDFAFRIQGALLIYTRDPTAARPVARAMNIPHGGSGPPSPQPLVNGQIPVALMRTCRQLNAESSPILYSANVFSSWTTHLLELGLAPRRWLVRHIVLEASSRGIFDRSLEHVNYCWKNRFWPEIRRSGRAVLERFPCLESLTFSLNPPQNEAFWRPGFFVVGKNKTREQRVAIVAVWMSLGCGWEGEADEGLKACLHLEMGRQHGRIEKREYEGSKFAPEDETDEDVWDSTEFADAFDKMKSF